MEQYRETLYKYYQKQKILFSRESPCLQELLVLIRKQSHKTLVLWSLKEIKTISENIPIDNTKKQEIQKAIHLCYEWACGRIKMPLAKKALLAVHQMAKEETNPEIIAQLHAVGQGCAVVHVETHAIGLVLYELTSLVHRYGITQFKEAVEQKILKYLYNLEETSHLEHQDTWARFLMKEVAPNKEERLYQAKLSQTTNR